MSSDIPTQVHRGLPAATSGTSFKRSFEQFGYDSDASLSNDHTEASGSSNPTRNPSGSSTAANERNKRARSTSSSSISDQSTDTSRSTDYDTAESSASLSDASRSDIDVPAGVNAMQALCPTVPILSTTNVSAVSQPLGLPETEPHDEEMLDDPGLPQDVPRELSQNTIASSSDAQDSFRNSIDRFNEFDSEIAALRRSHSNTPSWHSPPPITASPVPGESAHAMASALPWSSTQEAPPWISNTPSPLRNNDEDFFSGLAVSAVTVPRRGDLPSTDVPEEVASSSNPEHPVPLSNDTASSDPDPPLYIPPYPPYPSYRPSHRYGYMVPTPPPRVQGVFPADPPSSSSPTEVFDSPRRESGSSRPRDVEQSTDHEPGRPGWLWTRLQSMRRPPLAPSRRISSPLPGSGSTSSSDIASLGSNSSIRISPTTTSVRRSPTTSERSRRRTSIFRSPESPSSPAPSSPTDESSGPDHVRLFGRRPSGERERSWVPPWMAIHSRSDGVFGEERAGREHVNTDDLESRDSDAGSLPWFSQSQPQAQSQSQPQARAQSRSHRFPWHVAHPDATSPAPLSVPNRNSRVYGTSTAMSAHGPSTTTSAHGPSTSSTSTYNYGTSATRIPSNSLMSESVAEQRRTAARAQLRSHMSSLNHGLGHLFDEADEGAQPSSPTLPPGTSPPPHEIQRGSSSFLFPESEPSEGAGRDAMDTGHSGLPSATQHNLSVEVDWDADLTQLTPAQQYGMMLSRDRDLPDLPRDTEPLRPFTRDTRSSHFPRDTYTRQPGAEPHAYRNINLEPFQSGIFRDSVQRAAEGSHTRVQEGDHTRVHQSAAPVPGWQSRRLRSIIIPDDEDVQMDSDVEMPADIQAPETGWETSDVGRVSDSSSSPFSAPPASATAERDPSWYWSRHTGRGARGRGALQLQANRLPERAGQPTGSRVERRDVASTHRPETTDVRVPTGAISELNEALLDASARRVARDQENERLARLIHTRREELMRRTSNTNTASTQSQSQGQGSFVFPLPFLSRGDGGAARSGLSSSSEQITPRVPDQPSHYDDRRTVFERNRMRQQGAGPRSQSVADRWTSDGEEDGVQRGGERWWEESDSAWGGSVWGDDDTPSGSEWGWGRRHATPGRSAPSSAGITPPPSFGRRPRPWRSSSQSFWDDARGAGEDRARGSAAGAPRAARIEERGGGAARSADRLRQLLASGSNTSSDQQPPRRAVRIEERGEENTRNADRLSQLIRDSLERPDSRPWHDNVDHYEVDDSDEEDEEPEEDMAQERARRGFPYRPLSLLAGRRAAAANSASNPVPSSRPAPTRRIIEPVDRSFPGDLAQGAATGGRLLQLRNLRQRMQLERGRVGRGGQGDGPIWDAWPQSFREARRTMGDYMPDELFDSSYEGLLSLSAQLGEARSRATPDEVIASLTSGEYKDWATEDSETRCPICLDDYEPTDPVTKLQDCTHWLHKACLEQWLHTANTCPVCRKKVKLSTRKSCPPGRNHSPSPGPSAGGSGGGGPSGSRAGPSGSGSESRAGPSGSGTQTGPNRAAPGGGGGGDSANGATFVWPNERGNVWVAYPHAPHVHVHVHPPGSHIPPGPHVHAPTSHVHPPPLPHVYIPLHAHTPPVSHVHAPPMPHGQPLPVRHDPSPSSPPPTAHVHTTPTHHFWARADPPRPSTQEAYVSGAALYARMMRRRAHRPAGGAEAEGISEATTSVAPGPRRGSLRSSSRTTGGSSYTTGGAPQDTIGGPQSTFTIAPSSTISFTGSPGTTGPTVVVENRSDSPMVVGHPTFGAGLVGIHGTTMGGGRVENQAVSPRARFAQLLPYEEENSREDQESGNEGMPPWRAW